MDWLGQAVDLVLHLDGHLARLAQTLGPWIYGALFLIVFCETGLVVTPFLPGDSLLFAAGALAGTGALEVTIVIPALLFAAILGDGVNYSIGRWAGKQLVRRHPRLIRPQHLERTHRFFERHGGKTIVLARFVPIVRTFAPFVAGMGEMTYRRFAAYNVLGAILWVGLLVPAGYWFGRIPIVRERFELVVLGIVAVSLAPIAFELARNRTASAR